jgi:hypothetical protein
MALAPIWRAHQSKARPDLLGREDHISDIRKMRREFGCVLLSC